MHFKNVFGNSEIFCLAYNVGLHWSLLALVRSDGNHELFYMNSLNAHDSTLLGKRCIGFLHACHVACDPTEALPSYVHGSSIPKAISYKVSQQSDGYGCGCFTVPYTIDICNVMLQKNLLVFVHDMCGARSSTWFPIDK